MGAGKSTLGEEVARRLNWLLKDVDRVIETSQKRSIPELFAEGEAAFRDVEERVVRGVLAHPRPFVVALGGGAVTTPQVRELLHHHAITVWVDEDVETCWQRVRGSDRPLGQDEAEFRRLYDERRPLYAAAAEAVVRDADDH